MSITTNFYVPEYFEYIIGSELYSRCFQNDSVTADCTDNFLTSSAHCSRDVGTQTSSIGHGIDEIVKFTIRK